MFLLQLQKELNINDVDESRLTDALMHYSFLMGYETKSYDMNRSEEVLVGGTVMSLNPNTVKHTITVERTADTLSIRVAARYFPWEKSKLRDILSHRLSQLISYLYSQGIVREESISAYEKEVRVVNAPFTHIAGNAPDVYASALLRVLASMALCIIGVIVVMFIYGVLIIDVNESRIMLEVTFGKITKKELIGGGSVIGIAIGSIVGAILSIYFVLSEHIEFLNKRILSFGIFYTLLLCFFIIEEEAFLLTALIAALVPFAAYTFYYLVWGLKKVYLKSDK